MKTYNLDEEQFELVSTAIAETIQILKNVKVIDAIYMTNFYQVIGDIRDGEIPTIKIVPIYTEMKSIGKRNKKPIEILVGKKDNKKLEFIAKNVKENTGIKIAIVPSSHYDYSTLMMHYRELSACRNLYNGHILFDRNGKYTDMKNKLANDFNDEDIYSNAIEFKPALTLIKNN